VGNEENEYSFPDPKSIMISMTTEPNDIHKKSLKEEILGELIETLMEKLQEMIKQNVQNALKQLQDTTNKKT
jgi:hypothetical protein